MLILTPTHNNKLLLQWKTPSRVVERKSEVDCVVDLQKKLRLFQNNMVKEYKERLDDARGFVAVKQISACIASQGILVIPRT